MSPFCSLAGFLQSTWLRHRRANSSRNNALPLSPRPASTKDKEKLLNRVKRIKGQIIAIEKALDANEECSKVLQTIAACRGAINGLMAEVLEGHVRCHVIDSRRKQTADQAEATEELIDLVNRYLR